MEKSGGCHFNLGIKFNDTKSGSLIFCTPCMTQYEVNSIIYEVLLSFNLLRGIQGLGE